MIRAFQNPDNTEVFKVRAFFTRLRFRQLFIGLIAVTGVLALFSPAHAALPVADFSGSPTSGTAPLSVTFTDTSTGSPTAWSWDFDNDAIEDSNEQNPTFIFNTAGVYTVSLTATNGEGPDTNTKIDYITVTQGDWYVDAAVSSSGDGTSWATAFKTINEGISASGAGDTIHVAAGTYNERLVIDKLLTLEGAGWDATIVQPLDVPAAGVYDVEIDAGGTVIQGFRFDFNGPADDRGGTGIVVGDLNDPPVTNVQILNDKIYTGDGSGVGGTGIQTGKNCDVSGLLISGNIFYGDTDNLGEGIYVNPYSGAGDVTIQSNEFYGYLYSGVSIEASNVQVTGNTINSDAAKGFYGIRFIDLTGAQSFSGVLIANNNIQNVQYGISVGTSTDVGSTFIATVDSNTLSGNDVGLRTRHGADLTLIHNNFSGNTQFGMDNETTQVVAAENSWWGDDSGPYDPSDDTATGGWYNPTGAGDRVSDYVDYDPWFQNAPIAEFTASPTNGVEPLEVTFSDLSTGNITSWSWDFDNDGTPDATVQSPAPYTYASADTYTVALTVTGPGGSDTNTKIGYITVTQGDWFVDGAVVSSGDGTSWATAFKTINEGISASSAGCTVHVAAGTYNERLVIDKQLTLQGAGWDDTIVQPLDVPIAGVYDVEIDAGGTVIQGFRFDFNGPADDRAGAGIAVGDLDDPPVTDVQILNNKIYTGIGSTGIQTGKNCDVSGLLISGNIFHADNLGEGIYINPYSGAGSVMVEDNEFYGYLFSGVSIEAGNVHVTGNTINSDAVQGTYGVQFVDFTGGQIYTNVLISNNDIQNVQYGISIGSGTDVGSTLTATLDGNTLSNNDVGMRIRFGADLTIIHNTISGNTAGMTSVIPVDAPNNYWGSADGPGGSGPGSGDTVDANVDYSPWLGATYGTSPMTWYTDDSIQEAIDAASAGDTIRAAAGAFKERLVIDKQLTLIGAGRDSTFVQPLNAPTPGVYDVEILASGTVIRDFRFDFNGTGDTRSGNGIVVSDLNGPPVTNVQILNNKILYTGDANTAIQTGKYSDVSGLIISGNTIYGDLSGSGEGIYINPFTGAGTVTIQDNLFYGNLFSAVSIEAGNVTVSGNIIYSDVTQGVYGIRVIDLTGGENFSNIILSNNVAQNVQYGVSVGTSTDLGSTFTATIDSNTLANNDVGLRARYGAVLTVIHNNLSGNTQFGMDNETTQGIVAENNWWGDDSGPYDPSDDTATGGWYNPTGAGDRVSDYVDYDPWSQESLPIAEFTASPTSGAKPLDVLFFDESIGTITDYLWQFGDGQTSTSQNPVHRYSNVGDYTVRLTVTGPGGSTERGKVDYIHVTQAPPVASFTAIPLSGQEPLTVTFTNTSTGVIATYFWQFGDGYTSTQTSPTHQYQSHGDYTVRLTATGAGGSDIEEKIDYIHVDYVAPTADFAANPARVPVNTDVQFTDLSIGYITDYSWDFGDGQTSTAQSPVHQYQAAGDYTVRLTVTGPGGTDLEEKTDYIYVSDGPIADFSASPATGDAPLLVQFTDQSLGSPTSYYWEFGDGNTSTDQNPAYEYQSIGYYTVRLTVTGVAGPPDTKEKTDYIRVKEPPPVAEFTAAPTSGIYPQTVQFADLSTGVIVAYQWEFGDGQTSTQQNPVHEYASDGDYTVRLTVNGPDYSDIMEKTDFIHVGKRKWWAFVYGDSSGTAHDEARSVRSAWDGGYIMAGSSNDDVWVLKLHEDGLIAWEKTLGGAGAEKAEAIERTVDGGYIVAGVTDSFGAGGQDLWVVKLSFDGTIEWENRYGDAGTDRAFDIRQTLDQGYVIAGSSDDEILVLKLNEDGTIAWQKTYGDAGAVDEAYAVRQTADTGYVVVGMTDPSGAGNGDVRVLKLNADGTVAWQNDYGDVGDDRAYAVSATVDGGYIVAGGTSSFGAGGYDLWLLKLQANGAVTWQKAYGETGDEEARAVQETIDGGYILAGSTSSFGHGNLDLWLLKLNADGSVAWDKTYGQAEDDTGLDVQLTFDGGYIICGATESFGDGQPGFSDMWVLRDDDGEIAGCNPMESGHMVAVADTPVLAVAAGALTGVGPLNPSGTNAAVQDTSANTAMPCSESVKPVALFTADPLTGQNPLTVQFTDISTGVVTDYLWEFGDERLSVDQNPLHTFKGMGIYTVKLTVTGPAGSSIRRMEDYISVTEGLPIADFTGSPTAGTPPLLVEFNDASSEKWGSINTYFWEFGDGSTAWGDRTFHMYMTGGAFTVSLTVTGPGGSDTKTKVNYVHETGYLPLHPVVEEIKPKKAYPGDKIAVKGYNFGATQGDSILHIAGKKFDSSNTRIKLWSDTKITVKLPVKAYDCDWFDGKSYRYRKVWVTVGGEDSEKKRVKLLAPDTCP